MLHHPVKKLVQLLTHSILVSLTKKTEHSFFNITWKCFIINSVPGKILNMYHTADASVQGPKCLPVRVL